MGESFTFEILSLSHIRNVENAIYEALENKLKQEPQISDWTKLYSERWVDLITPEAIAHPAKFSRALIRHIYAHAIEEGWLSAGDSVLDCFGGVALGAFDAMTHGLCWQGVELEPRFVELGNQNIALWNDRYEGKLARWGTAQLVQGDSRKLSEIVDPRKVGLISSPPFGAALSGGGINVKGYGDGSDKVGDRTYNNTMHGNHSANLGNLKDGDFSAVVCSPHKAGSIQQVGDGIDYSKVKDGGKKRTKGRAAIADGYGKEAGQLSEMREGDFSAVISSPPFVESLASDNPEKRGGMFKTDPKRANDKTLTATYGETEGQLGKMKAGALITSPPFEKGSEGVMRASKFKNPEAFARAQMKTGHAVSFEAKLASMQKDDERAEYGQTEGNVGNQSGETFWQASRLILEQCHQVLAPGAHAIFVCKDFVRNKKIVPFCEQWAQLCEVVGFRLLHIHRAWLVEHKDGQHRLDGGCDDLSVERKSFFRRLAEKKGSPRIDYETVMCFKRI